MADAASGTERRHIVQLFRPMKDAIEAALVKLEASKAEAAGAQPS